MLHVLPCCCQKWTPLSQSSCRWMACCRHLLLFAIHLMHFDYAPVWTWLLFSLDHFCLFQIFVAPLQRLWLLSYNALLICLCQTHSPWLTGSMVRKTTPIFFMISSWFFGAFGFFLSSTSTHPLKQMMSYMYCYIIYKSLFTSWLIIIFHCWCMHFALPVSLPGSLGLSILHLCLHLI